jgi:hypothetical protein
VGIEGKGRKESFLFLREKQEQKGDHHCHRDNEEEVEDRLSHLGAGVEVDYEDNKDPEGDLEGL